MVYLRDLPKAQYGIDGEFRIKTERDAYGALLRFAEFVQNMSEEEIRKMARKLVQQVRETTYRAKGTVFFSNGSFSHFSKEITFCVPTDTETVVLRMEETIYDTLEESGGDVTRIETHTVELVRPR